MNRVETTKSLAAASRGAVWLKALDPEAKLLGELIPSVAAADGEIDGRAVRFMAVLPDPKNRYPRARKGEVGLLEGWACCDVRFGFRPSRVQPRRKDAACARH